MNDVWVKMAEFWKIEWGERQQGELCADAGI